MCMIAWAFMKVDSTSRYIVMLCETLCPGIRLRLATPLILSHLKEELAWAVDKQLQVVSTIMIFKKQL